MSLAGKRILITGANGFIGGRLTERLTREQDARVHALVRAATDAGPHLREAQIVAGDVTDGDVVRRAMAGCDIVVHCAAMQGGCGGLADFTRVNVGGTLNLLEAAVEAGAVRFVHISTINVHGMPPPAGVCADSPLSFSGDHYSVSKALGEQAARQFVETHDLPLVIVRPGCTYGPRSNAWTLQPLARVRHGGRVLIGRGDGICNAIYIDNLVDLILLAMDKEAAIGQAFIGAEGRGVTWREFYGAYARMLGNNRLGSIPRPAAFAAAGCFEMLGKLRGRPPRVALSSVRFYSHKVVFDISKSSQLLGYAPRVSFEEGMRQTREWLAASGKLE